MHLVILVIGFLDSNDGTFSTNISVVNGLPVYGISFRFGIKNEIHKSYFGTGFWRRYYFSFLMADTSSKRQKYTYFVKYVTFLPYIEEKSFLQT